ncbi:MAG: hypothetical protein AAGC90_10070 [Curtobacterium sp.]
MTTAAPAVTSSIDVESPQWLVIPDVADVTPEWRAEVLRLFAAIVHVDREAEGELRIFDDGREVDPQTALDTLLEFRASLDGGDRLVAGLGVPNRWPLPVVVSVGVADTEDLQDTRGLLQLAGAEGGLPVEQPAVDELPEHVGGEGPVVTRYDLDDDGAIWATVCAVRREGGGDGPAVDTRVLWRTRDLDVVPVFGPEVVDLLAAIRNEVAA